LPKNASIERQVITILWKREERREKREKKGRSKLEIKASPAKTLTRKY